MKTWKLPNFTLCHKKVTKSCGHPIIITNLPLDILNSCVLFSSLDFVDFEIIYFYEPHKDFGPIHDIIPLWCQHFKGVVHFALNSFSTILNFSEFLSVVEVKNLQFGRIIAETIWPLEIRTAAGNKYINTLRKCANYRVFKTFNINQLFYKDT